jgi:hypothetical protein
VSDYVSRLVARSMGAANVVRPETASLFEPRDAAPQQLLAEVDVEASSPAPPQAPRGEPPAPTAAVAPAEAPGPAAADRVPREPDAPPVEGGAASAVEPVLEPDKRGEPDRPEPAERTTAIPVEAQSQRPRSASATPEPGTRARTARLPSPGALSVLPPISPAPAPDEPPVVHVTIGRVDVRAVQSVPPAAPPAAHDREPEAPPQQTLSEYLRKGARP